MLSDTIFREYDIRGTYPATLHEDAAYLIGRAFASVVREAIPSANEIAVARDGRLSSPALEEALIRGLTESGMNVLKLGLGPTPMLYYGVCTQKTAGGIMITGSHNPKDHNGFKIMLGLESFFGADIQALKKRIQEKRFSEGRGTVRELDITEHYLENLVRAFSPGKSLTLAWDAGNGAAGEIVERLTTKLPGRHILLNTKIDGNFPAHHPDPSEEKNLAELIDTVRREKCDAGIAFDGDADRIGVVDDTGSLLFGDELLALYAADVLRELPGATVIADVKASAALFDEIARLGGNPLMWKTGHSHIKTKMKEIKAPLAGEMSGHMFFADRWFGFDDGIYASVRFASMLAKNPQSLASLRAALPKKCSTPEMRIVCEEERKFRIIDEVKERLKKAQATFSDVDGVRVSAHGGWWLLRASNTQAMLVARAEAESREALADLTRALETELSLSGVKAA